MGPFLFIFNIFTMLPRIFLNHITYWHNFLRKHEIFKYKVLGIYEKVFDKLIRLFDNQFIHEALLYNDTND